MAEEYDYDFAGIVANMIGSNDDGDADVDVSDADSEESE